MSIIEKNNIKFEFLSDINNKGSKNFVLVFTISEELNNIYKGFRIDLEESQGRKSLELLIITAYAMNKDGKIELAFINEGYKKKLDTEKEVIVLLLYEAITFINSLGFLY